MSITGSYIHPKPLDSGKIAYDEKVAEIDRIISDLAAKAGQAPLQRTGIGGAISATILKIANFFGVGQYVTWAAQPNRPSHANASPAEFMSALQDLPSPFIALTKEDLTRLRQRLQETFGQKSMIDVLEACIFGFDDGRATAPAD